ncbi:MAG: hypothetical protein MZV70_54750 [Desulfobacterales bacterium]|nr:hypothetical protein [Desulfobacterales bacterium]
MSLIISGKIVRKEKVLDNGQIHLAMGIRFDDLPPMLGGAFFAFAQSVGIHSIRPKCRRKFSRKYDLILIAASWPPKIERVMMNVDDEKHRWLVAS